MVKLPVELSIMLCNRLHSLAEMSPRAVVADKVDIDYNQQINFARNILRTILPQLPKEACSKINRSDPRWSG